MSSHTGRAALSLANDGFYVLPLWWIGEDGECACRAHGFNGTCKPGKHPIGNLVPRAHEDASIDPAVITTWWTLHPLANVGIALDKSGLVDIAPDSVVWFAEFVGRGLPLTMHFASGGGSGHEHWLYRRGDMPAVRINRSGEYDVMSDGYCVAPPSVHESRREYRWIDQVAPIDVPQWVCQFVLEYLTDRDAVLSDEPVVAFETDTPPVKLITDEQWTTWRGETASDRSNTLVDVARMLSDAGCQDAEVIASALAERDVTLGLNKYSHRRDASRRYREIAYRYGKPPLTAKLTGQGGSPVPNIGVGTGEPPGSQKTTPEGGRGSGGLIRWRNHSETLAMRPPAVDWLIEGIFGRTLITEVVAKVKVGKTTFVLGGLRAGIAGDELYCGRAVSGPFRVAYVTEEGESTFLEAMRRYGLNDLVDQDAFYTVFDYETLPGSFSQQVDELIAHATEDRVDVVILDTLSIIAGLDEEDHAGKAATEMHHVRRLAAAGFAVGILRHSRKSGGEVGDAGRGSSAISGYCDILLQLEPYKGDEDSSNLRVLKSRSRLSMTEPLVLEFDKESERYTALGTVQTREERLAERIKATLVDNKAFTLETAMSTNAVTLATKGSRVGIQRELKEMGARGDIHHATRGQAEVYWTNEPLVAHITHQVVPTVAEPVGTTGTTENLEPPYGGSVPEEVVPQNPSPGGRETGTSTTRKPPTAEAVAKRAAEKAARELARLEAADAAAPTLEYLTVLDMVELNEALARLSSAACSLDTETTGLSA
ncbi:MAG TPA: bifunctional DNA primase/polymerase, partial [Chloroflexota bacterium]|nr:bifunctional DNA primase/polymerase [Chloroflexota bacterium]